MSRLTGLKVQQQIKHVVPLTAAAEAVLSTHTQGCGGRAQRTHTRA